MQAEGQRPMGSHVTSPIHWLQYLRKYETNKDSEEVSNCLAMPLISAKRSAA
jgi:hypothetical protein